MGGPSVGGPSVGLYYGYAISDIPSFLPTVWGRGKSIQWAATYPLRIYRKDLWTVRLRQRPDLVLVLWWWRVERIRYIWTLVTYAI